MGLIQEYLVMLIIVLTWLLLGFLKPVTPAAVPDTTVSLNVSTTAAPKTVKEIEKEIESLVTSITKFIMPYFVRNSDLKLSGSCMSTFIKIFVDVRKLKLPAIKLLDAMAKPPAGLLQGTFSIMGDYNECLDVRATKKGETPKTEKEEYYHGQYCTVELKFPPNLLAAMTDYNDGKINVTQLGKLGSFIKEFPATNFGGKYFRYLIGVCLPSTCSAEDLTEILGLVPISFLPMSVKQCYDDRNTVLKPDQMVFLVVLLIIATLVLAGTLVDGWLHVRHSTYKGEHKDKFMQFLLAFSVYSNAKKLLKSEKSASGEIPCVNGMYVLGTFLVVIYHTYFLPFFLAFSSHGSNLGHYFKDFKFTLIATMGISIEAYFLFSGLFLVYPRFRRGQKNINVNIFKIIARRYLRLCPSMLLILGIIVTLPLLGSGPVWAEIFDVAADNTRKWWWTYALMVNNYLKVKDQNFLYLWFIPCLMQITILGAFLLWIIAKWPKFGIFVTMLIGVMCNIGLGIITAIKNYPPGYAVYYYHNREYFEMPIYTSPLSHMFSFGLGMILGYYMAKNPSLKWSKAHVVIGWLVSIFLTVGVQLILYLGHNGSNPNPVFSAIYAAIHRAAFALGLGWMILACTHGYGGIAGRIFCWKGFGPLSKLGYFAYLIHYIVITFHASVTPVPLMYSHYEVWMRFFGYSFLTFVAAYILYITFELPLTFVESLFLPTRPSIQSRQNNSSENAKSNDVVVSKHNGVSQLNGTSNVYPPHLWSSTIPSIQAKEDAAEHSKV